MLILATLSLLLTACTTATRDASIRRHLVGVWSSDSLPGKVIENKSDGTLAVRMNGTATATGKWLVSNGYVVSGPAEDWSQIYPSLIESNKVLSISKDKTVLLTKDGQSELTFHKQWRPASR